MSLRVTVFVIFVFIGFLFTASVGTAGEDRSQQPAPAILSPKDGAKVEQMEDVEGEIKAGWPVLFVKPLAGDEPWYVQPPVEQVKGGTFTSAVHFGDQNTRPGTKFRIVVLAAKSTSEASGFKRGAILKSLPASLPRSKYVTVIRDGAEKSEPAPEPRHIHFAGRSWEVKSGRRLGPGPNDWSGADEHVRVDEKGYLHVSIARTDDRWQCAEVVATESLGYGEYRWVISGDLAAIDPRVVLGLFVYENNNREIDFELSRWGKAQNDNAQFVVQPYAKDSMHRFGTGKAQVLTASFSWEKALVRGRCWAGEDTAQKPLADWKYTGRKIPPPGKERVRANLWLCFGNAPSAMPKQEVVIRSFHFEPAAQGKSLPKTR